jgi:MFS family permease
VKQPAAREEQPALPESPGLGSAYGWFLASAATWFGSWGMQQVMFSWLIVEVLQEDPAWVGTAQMVQMLPSVLFLLLGGALADHLERRNTLVMTHLAASLAAAALVVMVLRDRLSFEVLLVYAACWGSVQALHLPARESLLYDIGRHSLSRAIPGSTLVQFVGQATGNLLVGSAAWLGAPLVIGMQSALLLAGVVPTQMLPTGRVVRPPGHGPTLRDIRSGLGVVFQSPRLRSLVMLVAFNGFLFLGSYFVLLPVLVRDFYGGGVAQLSLLMMMFPLGTVSASGLLLLRGRTARRGRAHLLGQLGGGLCLAGIGCAPDFPIALALTFVWGLCGGVFLNMGRTLFQESAPESHRGRALSVYTLGLLGMAPLGTQTAGWIGQAVGAATGCVLAGLAMCGLIAASWILTEVRNFD